MRDSGINEMANKNKIFFFFLNKTILNIFIGNRGFQYRPNVGKKYAPNRANWVQKCQISLGKRVLPPCNPRPWTPARGLEDKWNDPFHRLNIIKKKQKKKKRLLKRDKEDFNIMLVKSMNQIAQIEFRNAKFPQARGLCPLATPAPWTPTWGLQDKWNDPFS